MKTQIITLLWCCFSIIGFGQSITDVEYFFNSDPGFGNGTAITVNANSGNVTQTASVAVGNLTGFNTLYIRAKDNNSSWSLYDNRVFYVTDITGSTSASNIAAAEYFFNTDPGFGNGTAISIDANTGHVTQTIALPVGNTLTGFNTLYIRTQDDLGTWSLYDNRVFYISQQETAAGASNIVAAEYFYNNDPGFGNGTAISVDSNTGALTQVLSLPINNLEGFNNLYIRTQDDLGVWSLYDKRLFYVNENQVIANITAAEYFYDTDPGFGNGTPAILTPTGNPNEFTVELATTDISCDFHDFYIRLQNEDGTWSLYDYGLDVEVFDNADPTIVTFPNITAALDASGQASITIVDVDNGTFDDCELVSVVLNQTQFDYTCANLGANTVTITATDAEAKVSTEAITINVVDNINPVAVTQDITVQLDASGNASITTSQIENGSSDNCSVTDYALDISSFDCSNLGANTVNLTVTDASGNSNTASATVTVEDVIKPTVVTQNITVQLDASGNATILTSDIDNGSLDNCTIASQSLDIISFTCSNLGANTVTLTVTDQSGNSETGNAVVTVEDSIQPTVVTQNITVQLDGSGSATITASQIENGSSDNCGIANSSLDMTSFDCDDLGTNTVTLSVTDQSGNTGTQTATVTVEDTTNPVAISQNITVQLDASGNATITADVIDNNSTDNCGITTKSLDISNFTCANIGANTVMLTVEDASGNSNSTSATVTVEDTVKPTVVTQNITVQLDASGSATITSSQIENGSSDNCAIASSSLDITTFDCDDLGTNTVTLSVTDQSGNTRTQTATVTVEDDINPVAIGQDVTIDLNGNASITITPNDVDNGSSDNCTFALNLDIETFTQGIYNVILTATDSFGNTDSIPVSVTITDSTLGIKDDQVSENDIKLYPIPTEDYLNISTELRIDSFQIYDLNGKLLRTVNTSANKVNLSSFSSGIYFLKFNIENKSVTKRIIKK